MQVQECRVIEMTRNMDLIRELLLKIEANPLVNGRQGVTLEPSDIESQCSSEEMDYHVELLMDGGFLKGKMGPVHPVVSMLTWKGHEFVDDIKDQGVWHSTKDRIKGLPGVALDVIAELAKAEVRKRLGLL